MRKNCLPIGIDLQPLDCRPTALPLELEKTSSRMVNFGYLNSETCLLYHFNNKTIKLDDQEARPLKGPQKSQLFERLSLGY